MGSPTIFSGPWAKSIAAQGFLTRDGQPIIYNGNKNYVENSAASLTILPWAASGAGVTLVRSTNTAEIPELSLGTGFKLTGVSGTDYARYRYTVDPADKGLLQEILFAFKSGGGYASSDFKVEVYTNAASNYGGAYTAISVTDPNIAASAVGNYQISSFTNDASANYYELRVTRVAGTGFIVFSSVQIRKFVPTLPIDLTSQVTGILPVANGGTNSGTALNNNRVIASLAGAIVELPAITGQRALISDANGLPYASTTSDLQISYLSTVTSNVQDQLDSKEPLIALPTTSFVFTDQVTGALTTINGWQYFTNTFGANVNLLQQPDDTGGYSVHGFENRFEPTMASPSSQYNIFNVQSYIDTANSGFALGTGGSFGNLFNLGYSHQGTSNTGSLTVLQSYSNLGNGTDPIDIGGYYGYFLFADINDNVNLSRGLQGFIFQPHVHAAATFSTGGAFTNVFNDAANIEAVCDGWISYNASPIIAGVHTNNNYYGVNINPTIGTFQGNAGFYGLFLGGAITTLGGNGYNAAFINPNITTLDNNSKGIGIYGQTTSGTAEWLGIDISTSQINTTGNIRGIRINVPEDAAFAHSAIEIGGRSNLNTSLNLLSGSGQVYGNRIGGDIIVPDATAITGTTTIANNIGFNVDTGDAGSSFVGDGLVDMSTVGFVGIVQGAGTVSTINFCLGGYAAGHTGTVNRICNFSALAVNTGAPGTTNETIGFYHDQPTGPVGVDNWFIRTAMAAAESYVPRLAVGDMASFKVANASTGIELDSTTKAVLISRMTTVQRNALTALDGMQVYDTDLNTNYYYENGSWVTHSGGGGSSATAPSDRKFYTLAASVGGSALTIDLQDGAGATPSGGSPVMISFRDPPATSGLYAARQVTAALGITIPSGTTLGQSDAIPGYIYIYALDNSGTVELAVSSSNQWDENVAQNTTAISGGMDVNTLYSTSARTGKAIRYLGYIVDSETTAGTWTTGPSTISLDYPILSRWERKNLTTNFSLNNPTAQEVTDFTYSNLVPGRFYRYTYVAYCAMPSGNNAHAWVLFGDGATPSFYNYFHLVGSTNTFVMTTIFQCPGNNFSTLKFYIASGLGGENLVALAGALDPAAITGGQTTASYAILEELEVHRASL